MSKALESPRGLGRLRSKILFEKTTLAKKYETNYSANVKKRSPGKVQFQFLNLFLL